MSGKEHFSITLDLVKDHREKRIEINYSKKDKKKVRINEIPLKRIGELMGNLNAVVFSPEDLLIIKEGPSERRRFVDIALSQLKPSYFYNLQQYNKVLAQKNVLLKEVQEKRNLIETIDIWNNSLVEIGSKIIKERNDFTNRLCAYAKENHEKITDGEERLEIKYAPSIRFERNSSIQDIAVKFKEVLDSALDKELQKMTTLYGPQRDDYEILLNGANIKLYGSQGQQRSAILSMKLSEIDLMLEETEEYPVLLLDDVMSELDGKRQKYLIKNIDNIQTFITSTDDQFFSKLLGANASYFYIEKGHEKEK